MIHKIKSRHDDSVILFEAEAESLAEAVKAVGASTSSIPEVRSAGRWGGE